MFSEYREHPENEEHRHLLIVAVCDLGMGIPRSLPRKGWYSQIKQFLFNEALSNEDGHLIQAAIKVGASRTGKDHRGKGLMEVRSVLEGLKGTMQIHSNCGAYRYEASTGKETCNNFAPSQSICGTVVVWVIPVEGHQES
jgi:hypothetical protein